MKHVLGIVSLFLLCIIVNGCALLSAAGISNQGQPVKKVSDTLMLRPQSVSKVKIDHSIWDNLLKKHVNQEGLVDYKGFKRDYPVFKSYLQILSNTPPEENWPVQELLAYYINLYNAFTVDAIVKHYPVNSIKDIKGVWTNGNVPVGSKNLSLGGIENGILRKMEEPRIHFAINCASISCPKLLNEAYKAHSIDKQLDEATKAFINSSENDISTNNLKLSSIFDWYKKDFKVNGDVDVIAYINQYSCIKINPNVAIAYKPYNWKLNAQN